MAPELRDGATAETYVLARLRDGGVRLCRRTEPGGDEKELAVVAPRRPARARLELAGAILADAMVAGPTAKMTRDYARLLPLPEGGTVQIGGDEIDDWLKGWRPPLGVQLWPFR